MPAYSEAYLDEVVETQGQLFDYIAYEYPDMDTKDFIETETAPKIGLVAHINLGLVERFNFGLID